MPVKKEYTEETLKEKLINTVNWYMKNNKKFYKRNFAAAFWNLEEQQKALEWLEDKIEDGLLTNPNPVMVPFYGKNLIPGKNWRFDEETQKWVY